MAFDSFDEGCCISYDDDPQRSFTQCHLIREGVEHDAWVESRFAVLNKVLKVRFDGEWEDGWVVTSVGGTRSERDVDMIKKQLCPPVWRP